MREPGQAARPIFYDQTRRRWSWVVRLGAAMLLVAALLSAGFVVSILALPLLPHNALPKARAARDAGNPDPVLHDRQQAKRQWAQRRDLRELRRLIEAERERARRRAEARRGRGAQGPATGAAPVVAGFYVNWEETSRASLRRNIDQLTHFFPEWLHLTGDGKGVRDGREREDRIDIDPFVRRHGLPIIPVLNNYLPVRRGSEEGAWNTAAAHALLSDPHRRSLFIASLKATLLGNGWQGVNIDLEQVAPQDRDSMTAFMAELYGALHPAGLLVTQDVPVQDDAYDLASLALWNDFLIPMLYDEHSAGDEAGSGSIAGIGWTRDRLRELFAKVPADKVVLGLGNYAYDWTKGDLDAVPMSYQSAIIQAKESADPDDPTLGRIRMDPASLNPYYRYVDDDDKPHTVWLLDATTAYNQWKVARPYSPRGTALWYLGAEDPTIWSVLGRQAAATGPAAAVAAGALRTISYGRQSEIDFEGEGEMLEVVALPSDGDRTITQDPATGLIVREEYREYPSAYVVRRYGYQPKRIALTFDDGPDPAWTPRILDILHREGVTATFFVVGKQAEQYPGLIARMWDDGHEVGNHTFTHPNMSLVGPDRTLLEITTTQRVIEAITGHTTPLFRPPYAIDVEPRTGGELRPIIQASAYGFIAVGEQIDPQDWNLVQRAPDGTAVPRTAADIVASVWHDRDLGSVLLLHDGGGDREATVEALPRIIDRLRGAGYKFISLADLRGVSRAAMFPPVRGRDEVLAGVDRWVFEASYLFQRLIVTLFTLSVVLGISRQVLLAMLALVRRRQERATVERPPAIPPPDAAALVSVVIAAYNEEKVISRTVETILASDYPRLEVIVVDDGSLDGTSEVVYAGFGDDARVRSLRKPNGGKASALNLGIADAKGDIIVALDADTLFAPDTVSRLVRHFADPRVGAVSGNVRVGNTNNVLTKWQALEYITSQNFDRRAYDLLDCITVVPGAVGAWRKVAIQAVGGYTSDTLAEDTDLTWKVRRAGWRILNDSTALAFTEAPETLRSLSRQRFRWAFGTLQNLVKHREALFQHGAFGWVALPSLWLYQILFPAISPIMDLTVLWALLAGNIGHVAGYYGLMVGVEFVGASLALWMDRSDWRLLPWLFVQRLVYRQLMYYVILKSVVAAVWGGAVGWNKLERRGTARIDGASPTPDVISAPRA